MEKGVAGPTWPQSRDVSEQAVKDQEEFSSHMAEEGAGLRSKGSVFSEYSLLDGCTAKWRVRSVNGEKWRWGEILLVSQGEGYMFPSSLPSWPYPCRLTGLSPSELFRGIFQLEVEAGSICM